MDITRANQFESPMFDYTNITKFLTIKTMHFISKEYKSCSETMGCYIMIT